MENELTTEHDIYISLGLEHPMKPTECKNLIDALIAENFALSSWGTHTKDEWIEVVNECQGKVDSFITTIESQNTTIEDLEEERDSIKRDYDSACEMSMANSKEALRLYDIVESQKEDIQARHSETIRLFEHINALKSERESLKAITELAVKGLEDISSMRSYKVDWESYTDYEKLCGVEDVANNTLTEIARLSHA